VLTVNIMPVLCLLRYNPRFFVHACRKLCWSVCCSWHTEIWVNCEMGVEICEGLGMQVALMKGCRESMRVPYFKSLPSYYQVQCRLKQFFSSVLLVSMQEIRRDLSCFCVNPLSPSGYYTYHQFNIQQSYVQPTQYIYVFCVDLRTNSDYFPVQH
jgi:hypothetical protein